MPTATRAWTSPAKRPGAAVPFALKLPPRLRGSQASQNLGAFLSTLGLGDCPSRPERVMVMGGRIAWKKPLHAFHRQEGCS